MWSRATHSNSYLQCLYLWEVSALNVRIGVRVSAKLTRSSNLPFIDLTRCFISLAGLVRLILSTTYTYIFIEKLSAEDEVMISISMFSPF